MLSGLAGWRYVPSRKTFLEEPLEVVEVDLAGAVDCVGWVVERSVCRLMKHSTE